MLAALWQQCVQVGISRAGVWLTEGHHRPCIDDCGGHAAYRYASRIVIKPEPSLKLHTHDAEPERGRQPCGIARQAKLNKSRIAAERSTDSRAATRSISAIPAALSRTESIRRSPRFVMVYIVP